jgi:hypothetical protein
MRLALALLLLPTLARADASVPAPPPLDDAGLLSLTRAVLRYGIVERNAADLQLVTRQPQLLIARHVSVPIEAAIRGLSVERPIRVLDDVELRERTERRQRAVFYVILQVVESDRDRASIVLGTGMMLPSTDRSIPMCCCMKSLRFARRGRRWFFDAELGTMCG